MREERSKGQEKVAEGLWVTVSSRKREHASQPRTTGRGERKREKKTVDSDDE